MLVAPCTVRGDINHPFDSGHRSPVHTAVSWSVSAYQHAVNGMHNNGVTVFIPDSE